MHFNSTICIIYNTTNCTSVLSKSVLNDFKRKYNILISNSIVFNCSRTWSTKLTNVI